MNCIPRREEVGSSHKEAAEEQQQNSEGGGTKTAKTNPPGPTTEKHNGEMPINNATQMITNEGEQKTQDIM